jgi:hypothetical protein
VTGAVAVVLLAGCSRGQSVTMPPKNAAPAEVLGTYLQALRAGDCRSAHALATSSFVLGNGELCGALTAKSYSPLGKPANPREGEVIFSTTLTTEGGDQSMSNGDHTWFYSLDRQADGAWRLVGGGSGP